MSNTTIQRIANLSRERFEREFLARGEPVIMEGGMDGWQAPAKWDFDYLKSRSGSRLLPIEHYPDGDRSGAWRHQQMTMGDYVALLSAGRHREYYLAEKPLAEVFPDLLDEVQKPAVIDPAKDCNMVVFVGRDTVTDLHFHKTKQAILAQVLGEKRVLLYPPSQTRLLYPRPWYGTKSNFSRIAISPAMDNLDKHPKFNHTQPLECMVKLGDMLFIPVHWWHAVFGDGETCSVTTFWDAALHHWAFPTPTARVWGGIAFNKLINSGGFVAGKRLTLSGLRATRLLGPACLVAEKLGVVSNGRSLAARLSEQAKS